MLNLYRSVVSASVAVVVSLIALADTPICGASTAHAVEPVSGRKSAYMQRPQMPVQFDRATVQDLLNTVEQPRSATVLKLGYFGRRTKPTLPVKEGYGLLRTALEAETVGSLRWYLLQGVKGWAAFRLPQLSPQDGFDAYEAIFDHSIEWGSSRMPYAATQAVNEYLQAVAGPIQDIGMEGDQVTRTCALKAWRAYLARINGTGKWPGADPDWSSAIEAASLQAVFLPEIDGVLQDNSTKKTFNLLFTASFVLSDTQPEKATALLEQARHMLSENDSAEEVRSLDRLVMLYERLYAKRDQRDRKKRDDLTALAEALKCQEKRVELTMLGWAKLVELQTLLGDGKGLNTALSMLTAPLTSGEEINRTAETLIALWQKRALNTKSGALETQYPRAGRQAATILRGYLGYLGLSRARDLDQELRARWLLGTLYLDVQERVGAATVLDIDSLDFKPAELSPRGRLYYKRILQLRASMGAGLK